MARRDRAVGATRRKTATDHKSPAPVHSFSAVIGDWVALNAAADEAGEDEKDAPSSCGTLCARLQTLPPDRLAEVLKDAEDLCPRSVRMRALASSIHNGLGRMQLLWGDVGVARAHLSLSLSFMLEDPVITSAEVEARRIEQCRQLGLAAVWAPERETGEGLTQPPQKLSSPRLHTAGALDTLIHLAPEDPLLLLMQAERMQRAGDFRAAIRHWQALAGLEGASMPQVYYERLAEAYVAQGSFPLASPEEEATRGKIDKHAALARIHAILEPKLYLEIGVQSGKSLRLAACPAIGIDPMPILTAPLPDTARLFRTGSDAFFESKAAQILTEKPDLVFIDGMHLFEFVLRDFINVEAFSKPTTVVVIDDIYPNHLAQAARDRRTRAWAGDVWKLHHVLKTWRPDLRIEAVDAAPTGLLVVHGLDPANMTLFDNMPRILAELVPRVDVPQSVLERADVEIVSLDELEDRIIQIVNASKN